MNVPRVLYHTPCVAFLEDLGDTTYVDVLDTEGPEGETTFQRPVGALLDFLFAYYKATQSLRGDVNLRNFLYRDNLCFGVDFEEPPVQGEMERDLGRMLAFGLTYDPAFSGRRIAFAHALWQGCLSRGLEASLLWRHMQREFLAMEKRRTGFAPIYETAAAFSPDWEGLHA